MVDAQTEIVKSGESLIRLENDTQMQMAVQRPRDEKAILDAAVKEISNFPSLAESAIYVKPVGKDKNQKMQYAEGLSIRAAESLASKYSNIALSMQILGQDADGADIGGTFLDYETNRRVAIHRRVSRFYKTYQGGLKEHNPDRFNDIVIPANMSKMLRELILRNISPGLRIEFEAAIRDALSMSSGSELQMRKDRMLPKFLALGVTKEMLERVRGKKLSVMDGEDIKDLIGIYNAMKDGETTIDELMDSNDSAAAKTGTKAEALKEKLNAKKGESLDLTPEELEGAGK